MRIRKKATDATRYKMSLAHRGKKNGMYGKHHSESTKQRISRSMKEYWREILWV